MRISSIRVFVLCFTLALISVNAMSQTSTSSLRGVVTDPKGAVIPKATVKIEDPANHFTRTVQTNDQGEYDFEQLPPATYNLTATSKGFAALAETVQLLVNTPTNLNIAMHVGAENTTVEVNAEAQTVNTDDATLGNAFNNQQVESLPLDARDPTELLSLQAGVTYVGNRETINQDFDSRNGAVQGARSDQSNVTLDGLDNNDQTNGYAFNGALRSTPDSLEEFRVTTTNSNADQGRSSGAQVVLVTKSGTNKWHGSLYEYNRPTITTANDPFVKAAEISAGQPNIPPKYIRNNFGGSVGGPIIKDRLFFFFNYEALRKREDVPVTRTVPSLGLRAGNISYVSCGASPVVGGATDCAATDPSNIVTLNPTQIASMDPQGIGIDPAILAVLNTYPKPNSNTVGDGLNYTGFTFASPAPQNQNTSILKLDYNITKNGNHRLFVRGNLQDDTTAGVEQFPGQPASTLERDNNKGLAAGYTATLSNNWINNFRWGYIRQGGAIAGLSDQSYYIMRGLDNPVAFSRSSSVNVPVDNFVDDVNYVHGKHTFQFGGNFRRVDVYHYNDTNSFSDANSNPSWLLNAGIANTGQGFDPAAYNFPAVAGYWTNNYDYPIGALAGLVSEIDTTYQRNRAGDTLPQGAFIGRHWRDNEGEFYLQDSWRMRPNLTITAGVRYTLLQPPYETDGNQVQPTLDVNQWFANRATAMLQGGTYDTPFVFNLAGKANNGKPYWNWDRGDVAPRFAFAYSPNFNSGPIHAIFGSAGKSSIRAGYGIYYDHFGEGILNTFDQYGSFGLTTTTSNPAGLIDTGSAGRIGSLTNIPTSILAPPLANGWPAQYPDAFAITWGLDDHLKTPYSHVVDFSVEREFPKDFVLETSYVGRFGRRLLQQEDLAMPLDIVDPKSGMDYFTAASMLVKYANAGTPISQIPNIPFWQNVFPNAAGVGGNYNFGCSVGNNPAVSYSATQNIYDLFACYPTNATSALQLLDYPGLVNPGNQCFPACSTIKGQTGPYHFYDPQFSSLYAWRSIGNSSYNGLEVSLRHHSKGSLQFDVNYTFSKSLDMGSDAERITEWGGPGGQIINSWNPRQLYALSDFNAKHQLNLNWVYEVPYGRGKRWGADSNRYTNALLGGWGWSGIFRISSGLPFSVNPGANWSTNWQLAGDAVLTGSKPATGTYMVNGLPNVFQNPQAALADFSYPLPGQSGERNNLLGPGFFNLDMGISKGWKIRENQELKFRGEVFNVTNSVRYDVLTMAYNNGSIGNSTQFGQYTSTLTQYRRMQFALRYEF